MDISTAGTTGPRASRTATWRPSAGAARPNWRMAGWRCSPPWVAAWRVPALGGACWMLVDGFNWFLSNNLMGFCTKHHKKTPNHQSIEVIFKNSIQKESFPPVSPFTPSHPARVLPLPWLFVAGALKILWQNVQRQTQLGSMRPVWPVFAATLLCWNLESPSLKTHIANIASKEFW